MSNPGWRGLLEEKEEALRACATLQGYTVLDGLIDEDTFHQHFIGLCKLSKVKSSKGRQLQLSNKFIDTTVPIIRISEGISKLASDLKDTKNNGRPESLIWKTSLTALEIGRRHGAGHDVVIDLQVELHKKVPKLANLVSTLDRWPRSKPIQEDLKNIYQMFIKFYTEIIKAYTTETLEQSLSSNEIFQAIIEEAKTSFSNANDTYNRNVTMEERSEAANSSGSRNTSSQPLTEFKLEFKFLNKIGEGSHGKVYRVQENTTKELYACKDIEWSTTSCSRSEDEVKQEILILKKMRHTHIVTISAYSQTTTGFRIYLEPLAEHNLKQFMIECDEQSFPSDKTNMILPWFGCLLHALKFAHFNKIKHRDIKLGNILVKDSHIYLSDFSLAKDFTEQESSVAVCEVAAGNLRYRAPEARNSVPGRRIADVFSLGCVYAEMLTVVCHIHFKKLSEKQKAEHKTDNFRDSLPAVVNWLHKLKGDSKDDEKIAAMCRTIRNMIAEDLDMRHTADQALRSVEEISEFRCLHVH